MYDIFANFGNISDCARRKEKNYMLQRASCGSIFRGGIVGSTIGDILTHWVKYVI